MVIPPMKTKAFIVLYLSLTCIYWVINPVGSVSFNFTFSNSSSVSDIRFEGDAHFGDLYSYHLDRISLTQDIPGRNFHNSTGRATYNHPVPLWDKHTGETTNFTTRFSFLIQNITPDHYGDGLAFFLSPYPSQIAPTELGSGSCLGLFNGSTSTAKIVAVEFDTFLNPGVDPSSTDPTDCQIGIDDNMIEPVAYKFIPHSLFVGVRMTVQIDYNSWLKLLSVLLWHDQEPETKFRLNATVDIRSQLPHMAAVGFSAATGGGVELHHIFSWSFNSTLKNKEHQLGVGAILGIVGGGVIIIIIVILMCCSPWYFSKNRREREMNDDFERGRGPKNFPYKELCAATNNFADDKKLGEGGFGSVYKGILKGKHVAVKRVSKDSKQGEKEYMSEVKIISQLSHRYLVPLVGWCHSNGEFLLVYQLMHNGSLDKHLYSKNSLLEWPTRQKIALGLGEALLYLHEGWKQCVVHRDIKPSNIMLDSSFNAMLGDFGLARLTNHSQALKTTDNAGTRGYAAPECALCIANASTQSDVYSFGVVLLEIVCGRTPIMLQQEPKKVSLVDWIWDLYEQNALLEAVDGRLNGNFEREEIEHFMIVGLWCTQYERSSRPSIDKAMAALRNKVGLPSLPLKKTVPSAISDSFYTADCVLIE